MLQNYFKSPSVGFCYSGPVLQEKAKEYATALGIDDFLASEQFLSSSSASLTSPMLLITKPRLLIQLPATVGFSYCDL